MVLFEIWSLGHRPYDACVVEKDVSLTLIVLIPSSILFSSGTVCCEIHCTLYSVM